MKKFILFAAGAFFLSVLGAQAVCAAENAREASFYEKLKSSLVKCRLCPRECVIASGKRGYCRVRQNEKGTLFSLSYSRPVAIHIDPIEKKPLFHFLPGADAFSVATIGCNLNCKFCQNWEISQARPEDVAGRKVSPEELIRECKNSGSGIIAYTYTEPTVFYEYMLETAELAHASGIRNVMHSNGYISEAPLRQLARYLDAANIDLKGFSNDYYAKVCDGRLEPVLAALKVLKEEKVHIEITNLILPGYNDDPQTIAKMCLWIKENLGQDTPLHFSRFFPLYKLASLIPTPAETLEKARAIALENGLRYVYIGNLPGHEAENTSCPGCRKTVIKRSGYSVTASDIKDGACAFCGEKIKGVWQ
jgi:pyruvate formate lyase activating enzyme